MPETTFILQQVEEATGYPIEIVEAAELSTLAEITRARPGIPFHLLRINPTIGVPDYLIAYECGFLLRLSASPPKERQDFAGTEAGRDEVGLLIKRSGQTAHLPATALTELAGQLFDGLMTQLRSIPIGMRIDRWLLDDYPALEPLQREAIARQHQDNLQVLSPQVRSFSPKPIYDASVAMNAAYALFCDRVFGKGGYTIPYRSAGFEKPARRLLDLWESIPDEASHDYTLVDAWATNLDLAGWYQWVPLSAPEATSATEGTSAPRND